MGYSILPVSLALFSSGILTQFELDQVQAAPTMYQQTNQLLSMCLSKGEKACCSFYQALNNEDPQLASDIRDDPGGNDPVVMVAEQFGGRASNRKVTGSNPGRAKK